MMKKITLLSMFLMTFSGFSQTFLDFTNGSYYVENSTVFSFSGTSSSILNDGGNNVFQIVGGTDNYDGVVIILPSIVTLSDGNSTVKFDMEVTASGSSGQHILKFEDDGVAFNQLEFTAPTTIGTHSISIDFPSSPETFTKLVIFTDGDLVTETITNSSTYNFDNFLIAPTLGTESFTRTAFETYPNPTKDNWTVKTQNIEVSSIQVFDVSGKKVMSFTPNSDTFTIDVSDLKSGLYFAQVETLEGNVSSIKLIKN